LKLNSQGEKRLTFLYKLYYETKALHKMSETRGMAFQKYIMEYMNETKSIILENEKKINFNHKIQIYSHYIEKSISSYKNYYDIIKNLPLEQALLISPENSNARAFDSFLIVKKLTCYKIYFLQMTTQEIRPMLTFLEFKNIFKTMFKDFFNNGIIFDEIYAFYLTRNNF
jgi:hypothetical protein